MLQLYKAFVNFSSQKKAFNCYFFDLPELLSKSFGSILTSFLLFGAKKLKLSCFFCFCRLSCFCFSLEPFGPSLFCFEHLHDRRKFQCLRCEESAAVSSFSTRCFFILFPTTPSASPRQGTWLTRLDLGPR